jgi:hypothetical protein
MRARVVFVLELALVTGVASAVWAKQAAENSQVTNDPSHSNQPIAGWIELSTIR